MRVCPARQRERCRSELIWWTSVAVGSCDPTGILLPGDQTRLLVGP